MSSPVLACILTSRNVLGFSTCAELIRLHVECWRQQFAKHSPQLLLVETAALQTEENPWQPNTAAFAALIDYCRTAGIPTVLWKTSTGSTFGDSMLNNDGQTYFPDLAARFDSVFTAQLCDSTESGAGLAEESIQQAQLLPFAANPRIRLVPDEDRDDIATLQAGQQILPEELGKFRVVVALDLHHRDMSPPPELFDLLAARVCVITNSRAAIPLDLQPFIHIAPDSRQAEKRAQTLLADEISRRKLVHCAHRQLLSRHTYEHRLQTILAAAGSVPAEASLISVIAPTKRAERIDQLLENFFSQLHPALELLLILHRDSIDQAQVQSRVQTLLSSKQGSGKTVRVLRVAEHLTLGHCLNVGRELFRGNYFAKMDDDNFYGPNFLSDLLLAFKTTDAAIVGKSAYYTYLEGSNQMALRARAREYVPVPLVAGGAFLAQRRVLQAVAFAEVTGGGDTLWMKACNSRGYGMYSTDRYNFIYVRRADPNLHTWKISEAEYLKKCVVTASGLDFNPVMI